ncbi:hypothetical protein [Streptomyces sp. NPDC056194]|uniref:hypothetical protein n=1 Tax=Streptomyces sp. NPDC056194 TaxID=3345744 RepID=UPI0035D606AE
MDNRKARRREEERKATDEIVRALVQARQTSRSSETLDLDWAPRFLAILGEAEGAVLVLRDAVLRKRVSSSMDLILWGAGDDHFRSQMQMSAAETVYEAYTDAVGCLGANLRGEALPKARKTWSDAVTKQEWIAEQIRQAEGWE